MQQVPLNRRHHPLARRQIEVATRPKEGVGLPPLQLLLRNRTFQSRPSAESQAAARSPES